MAFFLPFPPSTCESAIGSPFFPLLLSSDTVKAFTGILYFFSECNFHLFLCWSSSDTLLSSDWILGPALSYAVCTYGTRYWAQPSPMQFEHMRSIGPHNSPSKSCFSAPREKMKILIPSSDLPYDLVSLGQIAITRVCLLVTHPWLFSAQGMPSFNFGNSFVSHVQWLDENPTAVELFGNLSGQIPAPNFCTTINSLSNQFIFTFKWLHYSRTRYFLSFFHSFVRLQILKFYPRTISHTCKSS